MRTFLFSVMVVLTGCSDSEWEAAAEGARCRQPPFCADAGSGSRLDSTLQVEDLVPPLTPVAVTFDGANSWAIVRDTRGYTKVWRNAAVVSGYPSSLTAVGAYSNPEVQRGVVIAFGDGGVQVHDGAGVVAGRLPTQAKLVTLFMQGSTSKGSAWSDLGNAYTQQIFAGANATDEGVLNTQCSALRLIDAEVLARSNGGKGAVLWEGTCADAGYAGGITSGRGVQLITPGGDRSGFTLASVPLALGRTAAGFDVASEQAQPRAIKIAHFDPNGVSSSADNSLTSSELVFADTMAGYVLAIASGEVTRDTVAGGTTFAQPTAFLAPMAGGPLIELGAAHPDAGRPALWAGPEGTFVLWTNASGQVTLTQLPPPG